MRVIPCVLPVLLMLSLPLPAADVERGKRLHAEHCTQCHSTDMYTRKNPIVQSLPALKERIRQCELSNDLAWFQEEIDDVSAYLDAEFYKFDNN